jgi:hypothetical protein
MADQIHTAATELDAIVPEVWSARWFPTLLENLVWSASVARDYEGEIADLGDTVNATQFPQFGDANDMQEGETNDAAAITLTKIQLVINHMVVQDFIVTSKALAQSLDAQEKLMEHAFFSILKKIDQIIFNDVVPSAAAPDHSIAYDSAQTLALADLLEAKELLDLQNVPDVGQRQGVLGVAQYNDLFNIAGFTSRDFSPNANALSQGAITAPVLGFNIKFTTMVGAVCSFFDPIFMQMAVQDQPAPKVYDLGGVDGRRQFRVNQTVLFGNKQFDSLRVVQIA